MWARVCELMLGCWLVISPLILRGTDRIGEFVWIDITVGSVIVLLSLLSFWRPARWAHLGTAAVAAGLALFAYFGFERPGPPAAQNELTVAYLLLIFAIVPNEATLPPEPWRRER